MWKDFLYYSKGERRAIVFLLALLFILVHFLLFFQPEEKEGEEEDKEEAIERIQHFLATVREREDTIYTRPFYSKPKRKIVLSSFDPNLADSIELITLGIPPFVARNIIKYRSAGGRFREVADLAKIYGLSTETYRTLEPYMYISEAFQPKKDTVKYVRHLEVDTLFYKYEEGTVVDVNVADTAELKKIPGIGSGIARTIVAYRQRLGGFYDLEQLKEIEWVDEEMMKWFVLGQQTIERIQVNKAGLDKLRSHPYINFYQAKVIVEYRKKKGKLKSLSQLSLYEEFTEKDLERLSHYLQFD